MAISRAQLAKELEPGLNALFGMEYDRYEGQHAEIFTTESSDRAFEEEVMLSGFGSAPTKSEGAAVNFDDANEAYTARYNHETIALAFSITEEAMESASFTVRNGSKTRVQFIKYHEAADQQPLSKKAAEKLGIFPSLALSSLAAWVRQNGFDVDYIDLHV